MACGIGDRGDEPNVVRWSQKCAQHGQHSGDRVTFSVFGQGIFWDAVRCGDRFWGGVQFRLRRQVIVERTPVVSMTASCGFGGRRQSHDSRRRRDPGVVLLMSVMTPAGWAHNEPLTLGRFYREVSASTVHDFNVMWEPECSQCGLPTQNHSVGGPAWQQFKCAHQYPVPRCSRRLDNTWASSHRNSHRKVEHQPP